MIGKPKETIEWLCMKFLTNIHHNFLEGVLAGLHLKHICIGDYTRHDLKIRKFSSCDQSILWEVSFELVMCDLSAVIVSRIFHCNSLKDLQLPMHGIIHIQYRALLRWSPTNISGNLNALISNQSPPIQSLGRSGQNSVQNLHKYKAAMHKNVPKSKSKKSSPPY